MTRTASATAAHSLLAIGIALFAQGAAAASGPDSIPNAHGAKARLVKIANDTIAGAHCAQTADPKACTSSITSRAYTTMSISANLISSQCDAQAKKAGTSGMDYILQAKNCEQNAPIPSRGAIDAEIARIAALPAPAPQNPPAHLPAPRTAPRRD
jgi:hypothetical protein